MAEPPEDERRQLAEAYVRAILTALARVHFMLWLLVLAVAVLAAAFIVHVITFAGR